MGLEYNFYPAGNILAAEYEISFLHHAFNQRIGYNQTKRKDFSGYNDDEKGGGIGISLGYRYYFKQECSGFYLGSRLDWWNMKVDWIDSSQTINKGSTQIVVLQPTFEIGYAFPLGKNWQLNTAFVNGMEFNVVEKGDPVGQGWITLWQVRIGRYFRQSTVTITPDF
ncbi:MAG: hypothetical protein ACI83I_000160 [Bacteroidia bacterium]|jgi:hypothetical protein